MDKQVCSGLMNVAEAAVYLRLSIKTLRNWCYKGLIPNIKLHGVVRFRQRDLDAWIQESLRTAG